MTDGSDPSTNAGSRPENRRIEYVRERANWMRRRLLRMIVDAGQGHPGGDLSATDILAALYFDILRIDPANPRSPDRDRFVMSKGHCTGALYSALAGAGFFPEAELDTYLKPESRLNGHPNRTYLPGVETNTGPLGHGLPVAVGIAVAAQIDGADHHVFALTGDGELQEGSMWEAAMFAGHRGLGNLTVIVDRNRLQQGAGTENTNALEPLADKWRAFGWRVEGVDGHDPAALLAAFDAARAPRETPLCLIADTHKGQGVSFMRDQAGWHHGVPNAEQYAQAIRELEEEMAR
ncbi:transketolase [Sphingopyxis panaciterrulae]|uniref:Transketolase n=1 Tax=Sphingopyxis panaciterrulae TaxID=462372 RepID=A0A7W9B3S6_9SPHN|nr:transketolase [Sphingopyxis panaciterrulae]MBB5705716.1 transketolase [Sphingopyxis panaciterrulae]